MQPRVMLCITRAAIRDGAGPVHIFTQSRLWMHAMLPIWCTVEMQVPPLKPSC